MKAFPRSNRIFRHAFAFAFDDAPSVWLGVGYTLASHKISLNTNDATSDKTLPQLTDAKANATTGDIRTVAFAIAEALFQAWLAQGAGGQPRNMVIRRSASSAGTNDTVTYTYQLQFTLDPSGTYTVDDEPA